MPLMVCGCVAVANCMSLKAAPQAQVAAAASVRNAVAELLKAVRAQALPWPV
jgi:ABC-type molybdate transport system substrate-binding protein